MLLACGLAWLFLRVHGVGMWVGMVDSISAWCWLVGWHGRFYECMVLACRLAWLILRVHGVGVWVGMVDSTSAWCWHVGWHG